MHLFPHGLFVAARADLVARRPLGLRTDSRRERRRDRHASSLVRRLLHAANDRPTRTVRSSGDRTPVPLATAAANFHRRPCSRAKPNPSRDPALAVAMALTTEQQTSHLSRLQQEVLTWDYYRMGGEEDAGASSGRTLREVPYTFASITEYLDVFEPLVLEECAAQLVRGDEEDIHPSTIGAVFRSERREGFHVVQFILGEEAMSEFHDNDLILVSKTDPAADQNADEDKGDREDKNDKADKADKAEDGATDEDAADAEDGLRRVYALGYVDGRDSRNMMRVRFYLPEPAAKVTGNTAHKGALGDEDYARFRAVRNALASPRGAWYLMHLANMSTIAREWLALHAFPALPFAHAILSGKPSNAPAHSSWELPAALRKSMHAAYNGTHRKNRTRARQGADPVASVTLCETEISIPGFSRADAVLPCADVKLFDRYIMTYHDYAKDMWFL